MATLEQLKEDLRVDFTDDDSILQRNLDAATAIIEKYTGLSMSDKTLTFTGKDKPFRLFDVYPIDSVDGGTFTECSGGYLITPTEQVVTVEVGSVNYPNLDKAVLRIAADLYENIEVSEVNLPVDIQILVNQYRRTSFIS